MMLDTDTIDYDADEWQRRERWATGAELYEFEWQYADYDRRRNIRYDWRTFGTQYTAQERWMMMIALATGYVSADYYRRYVTRQTLAQVYGAAS